MRIFRALALALVALAVVAGVGAVGAARAAATAPPTFVDEDHDGIDDSLEQTLADRFAPVILIEPDESNYPVNVEWFLQRAHLQYHEDCTGDDDEDLPNVGLLGSQQALIGPPWTHGHDFGDGHPDAHCGTDDTGFSHPPHRAISTIAADPDGLYSVGDQTTGYADQQTWLLPDLHDTWGDGVDLGSTNPQDWKTYVHVYPALDGGVMLQYWHLFAYNDLSVAGFGQHGGDWDATIHVHVAPDLRHVEWVWFSRHGNDHPGDKIAKDDVTWIDGTHPLMAIDGGGHAAYAGPDDFCTHHSIAGGQIAWPTDPNDPLNVMKLRSVDCDSLTLKGSPGNDVGGIVWETWDGGEVTADHADLTHDITAPSGHGGMVDVGEYNPCTPTACFGDGQASPFLAGQFHPLNGQVFIEYSGRWGSLPHCDGDECATPPRGPVFQGFDGNAYESWYNEAALRPANPTENQWRVAPTVAATIDGPQQAEPNGWTYVAPGTTVSLAATENSIAQTFAPVQVYYRVYQSPYLRSAWQEYSGPFSLPAPDGGYYVDFYAVDPLDNQSEVQTLQLARDSVAPTTTASIAGPNVSLGGVTYVGPAATVGLTATLGGPLASAGTTTSYRVYPAGDTPPAFSTYTGPISLPATDGAYRVDFRSADVLGNQEATQSLDLTRDSVAPQTSRTLSGPTATRDGVTYLAAAATLSLDASLDSPIAPLGTTTYVRIQPGGDFAPYTGPLTLPASDGAYEVDYYSVDALGNEEAQQSVNLTRDGTAPAISIAQPTATDYTHSATLTLDYGADDGSGSGVATVAATLDGSRAVTSGQAIPLLTELSLGSHTLAVTATDAVGNTTTTSVTFDVVVTAGSVKDDVPQLVASGDVASNRATSLLAKLDAAAAAGDCADASADYLAFQNEVRAQTGKSVDARAAAILTADAQYLVDHCT